MQSHQITAAPHGHVPTNVGVWSHDSRWIVSDVRSAADGSTFDGTRIERVEVATGRVEVLYESGRVTRLTPPVAAGKEPRPEACVISPCGRPDAFVQHLSGPDGRSWNQVVIADVPELP